MRKVHKIGVMPGEGIGKDVIKAALMVLETLNDVWQETALDLVVLDVGEDAVKKYGVPFPNETFEALKQSKAALFGAAGPGPVISRFRKGFNLYANVRPIKALPGIHAIQPGADFIIVRENTEGLYGRVGYIDGDHYVNLRIFTRKGMERIIRFSFELALNEDRKKVTFAHKAHVLTFTDEPMKQMFYEIAREYSDVEAEDMTVDACAMQIVMKPERFKIILAENANGDILSDVGAGIIGGLGFAPGGNIGNSMAVFEPIHGTAPKHAGKDVVNPIAAILATKMMLRYLGEEEAALHVEQAISEVLIEGKVRTYDIGGTSSTTQVAMEIAERIRRNWPE